MTQVLGEGPGGTYRRPSMGALLKHVCGPVSAHTADRSAAAAEPRILHWEDLQLPYQGSRRIGAWEHRLVRAAVAWLEQAVFISCKGHPVGAPLHIAIYHGGRGSLA